MLQEQQYPLKNTTANRSTTSSPAGDEGGGGAMVDKPFDDGPSPTNSIMALAADLDPASVQTLDNSQDTKTNAGLARWHVCCFIFFYMFCLTTFLALEVQLTL